MFANDDMQRCIRNLRCAEAEFNEADTPQKIDAAIYRMSAAEADIAHLRVVTGGPVPRRERRYQREVVEQIG